MASTSGTVGDRRARVAAQFFIGSRVSVLKMLWEEKVFTGGVLFCSQVRFCKFGGDVEHKRISLSRTSNKLYVKMNLGDTCRRCNIEATLELDLVKCVGAPDLHVPIRKPMFTCT